ncbi:MULTISPECIES: HAD family hydrolase [unclassified Breznakia]|uniref:HAD family hydrolase n=1 Tax=unclassified Breznakia TaxID=2623764 RepID=UPI002473932C|nr:MULTISPECIES: HAD family hydrolase [unclassified Breznakia]MDH6366201.1 Cof subfamily protein (haloacid dehalogenase superfamily) [Breznakia sp. PH1-1]MDH6403294.1 Cof subfamily protein (haloacid dehalogenase superfamily) [Breznakia sp. PF1-11]MDH6411003.1 Cof subfamily protein (haloacid dehalogenase superfamily) [Breznakia sp. PFB1-11]MDH6413367.1 Cof subfamily protein (haloacid dehalogenase superfamily) [Breznakia sp. PFB1-14]MDH6416132.1 Cof subfamily protein (haloacid dehalogenase super
MKDIKIAAFDVDGTLFNHITHRIEEDDLMCLNKLREQGMKLAIASGRPPYFVKEKLSQYFTFDYYICLNGTYIMDHAFNELYSEPLSKQDTENLVQDFTHFKQYLQFQFPEKGYLYAGKLPLQNRLMILLGRWGNFEDHRKKKTRHTQSLPLAAVSRVEPSIFKQIKPKYPHLQFDKFFGNGFDIHPKKTSKANAIAHICEHLGCTMEQAIAFGDNYNDISMIEACGIGVAMGNAVDEVKAKANFVTKPCGKNGIYEACKHFEILK